MFPGDFAVRSGFSICTHLSSWVSFPYFLQTLYTCLQHLSTCFIGWNVNPHWLVYLKRIENEKKLFPCYGSSGIQMLQMIFPARSNIWAHFLIDMSSIFPEKIAFTWLPWVIISLHQKNASKYIFLCPRTKISVSEANILILSLASFQRFSLTYGENVA